MFGDSLVTIDAGTLERDSLAKISAILSRPRFRAASIKRHPVGKNALGCSRVTVSIREHSHCESISTARALREEFLEAKIPGFFSYCDNCYSADIATEIGKEWEVKSCANPDKCIGRQKFPCPHCGKPCTFEELERTAGACCAACEP